MTLPTLDELWRTGDTDDRELIRDIAGMAATDAALTSLTDSMNSLASVSPPTVAKVQAWIDEIIILEADYADRVADNTAHLGDVKSYEGLRPGLNPTRQQQLKAAGPLQWDTESVLKVRFEAGDNPSATASGQLGSRLSDLKARIVTALALETTVVADGTFALIRS